MAGRPMEPHYTWCNLPYFYEHFQSTEEVTRYIKKRAKGKAFSFLLRPSNRDRKLLTASMLCTDQTVRHTHIYAEPNGDCYLYFLVVEKKFSSVGELVNFYEHNPVKNLENVNDVFFRFPINRNLSQNGSASGSLRSLPPRAQSMSSVNSGSNLSLVNMNSTEGPPLPVRPRAMSSDSGETVNLSSFSGSGSSATLQSKDISSRPPLPLPIIEAKQDDGQLYVYSKARDVNEDISERLKDVLKSNERCECGIPRSLAELPLGWTVHLSKDPLTAGKLFYQNDQGQTSWTLPYDVKMQLTNTHISNLQKIDKNWKFPH